MRWPRRELTLCKTGRHWWAAPEDAAKCCNGWVRQRSVHSDNGVITIKHIWVKDDEDLSHRNV